MDKSFSPHKINNQLKLGLFFIRVSSSTSLDKKKWDIFIGKVQFMCAYDIDARFIYFFSKGKKSMDFIAISSYLMAIIKYSCCCVFFYFTSNSNQNMQFKLVFCDDIVYRMATFHFDYRKMQCSFRCHCCVSIFYDISSSLFSSLPSFFCAMLDGKSIQINGEW